MRREAKRPAMDLYNELTELLGDIVGPHPWQRADLFIDRATGLRQVIVYADTPEGLWDRIAYDSGMQHFGDRNGSDGQAVIGAVRVLAAAAGDVVRVANWPQTQVTTYHVPMHCEAYEPLIGVGIENAGERLAKMRELMGA